MDDNVILCALEHAFSVEKISPGAGLEPGTASSVGQPGVRKFKPNDL